MIVTGIAMVTIVISHFCDSVTKSYKTVLDDRWIYIRYKVDRSSTLLVDSHTQHRSQARRETSVSGGTTESYVLVLESSGMVIPLPTLYFLSVNPVPRIGEPCTRDYKHDFLL